MATAINLSEVLRDVPAGAWAAVWQYRVISFGADLQQVLAEARSKGIEDPIILKATDRPETQFF